MARKINKHLGWTLVLFVALGGVFVFYYRKPLPKQTTAGDVAAIYTQQSLPTLEIPALDISAPIIYSTATTENKIQTELQSGVVHLAGTAPVGEVGNAFIVGHSSNYKDAPGNYNQIFASLPQIHIGDTIRVRDGEREYNYIVSETKIVRPTELWVESQATDGAKILTLQTSYPVGTAKQRFIVISKLAP